MTDKEAVNNGDS